MNNRCNIPLQNTIFLILEKQKRCETKTGKEIWKKLFDENDSIRILKTKDNVLEV
ncbi:hypothetical protein KJ966_06185 [bacterium]|nr:hypothetical protein [bacterium]